MQRQSSCGSTSSSGSSPPRGRLMFTVLAALANSHSAVCVPTADQWLAYGAMQPPPRADVDAALAASAMALRAAADDPDYCSECRAQQRGRGGAKVKSVADNDTSRCARCATGAQAGGCFPVLRRRRRRVSPEPLPAAST